jgi:hypothetical protein
MWPHIKAALPPDLDQIDTSSYETTWFGHDGIDFHEDRQLDLLARWKGDYGSLFELLRTDPRINTNTHGRALIYNGWYPTPDAETYAAMIADYGPAVVIEVGGGFSTLIARATVQHLRLSTRLVVVDPAPRIDVRDAADQVLYAPVETVDPAQLPIEEKTLLFIDSSHVARPRGDVPFLYNQLLPRLHSGSLVHAHDIFIPYDYPPRYQARLYSEQYVLQALLTDSSRWSVVFSAYQMSRAHAERMRDTFGEAVGPELEGTSFWFTVL